MPIPAYNPGTDAVIDCAVQGKSPYPCFIRPRNNVVSIQIKRSCFSLNNFSQYGSIHPEAIGKFEAKLVTKIEAYSWCPSGFGIDSSIRCSVLK